MSKHWRLDDDFVRPLPTDKGLKSIDEFTLPDFVGRMDRVRQAGRSLPEGAKAGLVLIAAACVGVAVGLYQAFGPRDAVAPEAKASAVEDRSGSRRLESPDS